MRGRAQPHKAPGLELPGTATLSGVGKRMDVRLARGLLGGAQASMTLPQQKISLLPLDGFGKQTTKLQRVRGTSSHSTCFNISLLWGLGLWGGGEGERFRAFATLVIHAL